MKDKKPLVVIVKNRPSPVQAKKKIKEISKIISELYSQEIRKEEEYGKL